MKKLFVVVLAIALLVGCAGLQPTPSTGQLIQSGKVQRTGVGEAIIKFKQPFANNQYQIVGTLESTGFGFNGGQAIRFPMKYRTPDGCKMSVQSTEKLGRVAVNWVAVGEARKK